MKPGAIGFATGLVSVLILAATGTGLASAAQHMQPEPWGGHPTVRIDSTMPAPFNTALARNEMANGRNEWHFGTSALVNINLGTHLDIPNSAQLSDVPIGSIWITDEPIPGVVPA